MRPRLLRSFAGRAKPGESGCQEISCACFETRLVALLSMKEVVDGITGIPHPEEAAERLSRRTRNADPASRQFPDSLEAESCFYHIIV